MPTTSELQTLVEQWRIIAHSMRDVVGRQSGVVVSTPVLELSGRAAVYETCADALAALIGPDESEGKEARCATCNGEGVVIAKYWPRQYVTREMAMDAGDLSMEGSLYSDEEYEYEQCTDCAGKEER